jgi:hypothetical protein
MRYSASKIVLELKRSHIQQSCKHFGERTRCSSAATWRGDCGGPRRPRTLYNGPPPFPRHASSASVGASQGVRLTPEETNLFDFLLYIQHLYAPKTRLRVAGGWVRDKLRGAESADIDIVLDNMRGKKFAGLITKFQRQRKLPASSVGIVKANSDKVRGVEGAAAADMLPS